MGVEHYYGNTKTLEFIEMGKGNLWTDLYYDLIRGEINLSLVKDVIRERYHVENAAEDYTEWVAKNVSAFFEKVGENLILMIDDYITFFNEEVKLCDEIEPPFHTCETLLYGKDNPWKMVWDRYIRCYTDYVRKNL